jgi:hypothetical protein
MRWLLFVLILVHGAIHFMGFAKGFGLAELPELTQPVPKSAGVAWLLAGVALLAAAALLIGAPRIWWMMGFGAVLLSQVLIVSSWRDAKLGTLANLLILASVAYSFASR